MVKNLKSKRGSGKATEGRPFHHTGGEIAPVKAPKRSLQLEEWLQEVGDHAIAMAEAGNPKGACLIPNPQTGGNDCIRTDEATCGKLQGTWIGGPCGPD